MKYKGDIRYVSYDIVMLNNAMKEDIFNIFPLVNNGIISIIGFRVHQHEGNDAEKLAFLKERVEKDVEEMAYVKIPPQFTITEQSGKTITGITELSYHTLIHNGTESILYEPIFQLFEACENPLMVVTHIVDGEITIDQEGKIKNQPLTSFPSSINELLSCNYRDKYNSEEGFYFDKLINDDFFQAIRILYNKRKYVSSLKLLLSAIDSFAFLKYGDEKNIFCSWLDSFCDMERLNISAFELWELRNSLLHMTNAYSRNVVNKKVQKLTFYVSKIDKDYLKEDGEAKYFNLRSLITVVANGVEKWASSYNSKPSELTNLFERYDLIISDIRYDQLKRDEHNK